MRRYFGRKLFTYTLTFFIAATIDWLIPRFMPGDPVASLVAKTGGVSSDGTAALVKYYNDLFGLNKSMPEQFINFWVSLLQGDLGRSVFGHGRPVTEQIMGAVPFTLALLIPAILLSWWAGNSFGALAARRKWLDNTILPVGYILTATPYMWLGLVFAFVLGFTFKIFPLSGGYGYNLEPSLTWRFFTDLVAHWIMPFLSLFVVMFGGWAIGMRNMIIYELESDYSRYLEALGAPQGLVRKYAFRNAMLPQITGLALQLQAAGVRLIADLDALVETLVDRARAEAGTVMMGRTHSVHAEPTTMGMKIAGWAFEIDRDRTRLAAAADEAATGKISGPVGTYSHLEPDLEDEVLLALGLHRDQISTQIVQRDRHAALIAAIAITGGSLERIATEIRNLQHTEIGELMEPFRVGQKGSSAMPHKRNPILSERIAGMARLLRGYAVTALENQPLWHERDISHSSAERVLLPDATILLDYMLVKTRGLVEKLVVRPERMRENIERGLGLHCSSRVLMALVEQAGLSREEAYAVVQRNSLRAADERRQLRELLAADPDVAARLSDEALAACFDESHFLRNVATAIARLDSLSPARKESAHVR